MELGGSTEGTLTEGFWYYYNKTNSIDGGTWKRLQSEILGSTSVVLIAGSFERAALTGDVTAAANLNATTIANNAVTSSETSISLTNLTSYLATYAIFQAINSHN